MPPSYCLLSVVKSNTCRIYSTPCIPCQVSLNHVHGDKKQRDLFVRCISGQQHTGLSGRFTAQGSDAQVRDGTWNPDYTLQTNCMYTNDLAGSWANPNRVPHGTCLEPAELDENKRNQRGFCGFPRSSADLATPERSYFHLLFLPQ